MVRSRRSSALIFGAALVLSVATLGASPAFGETTANPPKLPDTQTTSTAATAAQTARQYKHPVAISSETTPTTQVSALPDGNLQLVTSTVPVRTKAASGWVALDLNLSKAIDGLYAPQAADTHVEFGAGGSDVLARVQSSSGAWLAEASPFGALPAPSIDGAVATYKNVLPDVDLILTASATGMYEVLVVKTAIAAANPALADVHFAVSDAAISSKANGGSTAKLADGSSLQAGAPMWWDSAQGGDASRPGGNAVPQRLSQSADSSSIALNVASATATRKITYPLFVDPDWTGGLNTFWYIDQAYPTQSYLNGAYATGEQRVGYVDAANSPDSLNHLARSFFQLDTTGVEGKTVLAAQLSTTEDWAFSCTKAWVGLYWTTDVTPGATWNTTPSNVYIQEIDRQFVAKKTGGTGDCAPGAVGFNALTAAQAAASSNASHVDLALRAEDESHNVGWKRFAQSATLTITYDSTPATPTSLAYATPIASCSTSLSSPTFLDGTAAITLQDSVSDSDAGQNLATTFDVIDPVTHGVVLTHTTASQAQTVSPQYLIAANSLQAGVYGWDSRTSDGTLTSPTSVVCYFEIENTGPAAPGVVLDSTSTPVVGEPLTFHFTSVSADAVREFAYWIVDSAQTTTAPMPPSNPRLEPGDALPACGSYSSGVHYVCPATGQTVATGIKVAPTDNISTLWVVSYNAAARVSADSSMHYAATGHQMNAASDTTNVSFNVGHQWQTEGVDGTNPDWTLPDANTNAGYAVNDSDPIWWSVADTQQSDILGPPETSELHNYHYDALNIEIGDAGTYATGLEDTDLGGGTVGISELGGVVTLASGAPAPANSVELYACNLSSGEMTSTSPTCEGKGVTGSPLGYAFAGHLDAIEQGYAGYSVELDRCVDPASGHYFDSTSGCAGDMYGIYSAPTLDTVLGWVAGPNTASTSGSPVVDTTGSFTTSVWLNPGSISPGRKYVALGQEGLDTPDFELFVDTSGKIEFCVHTYDQADASHCVEGPALAASQWTMVTGVWDQTNQELRLLLGSDITPVASAEHDAYSLTSVAPDGNFTLGSGVTVDGRHYGMWDGMLADPAVFPGVIASDQLSNLANQLAP